LPKFLGVGRIKAGEWLKRNNVELNQRAESLNLKDWINLTEGFKIKQ